MPRLIDADKVADFVCSVCGENCDDECRRVCLERQFTEKCAEKMPTVEAIPIDWILNHEKMPKSGKGHDAIMGMIESWGERREDETD